MRKKLILFLGIIVAICMMGNLGFASGGDLQPMPMQGSTGIENDNAQDPYELVVETVTYGLDNPGLSMVEEAVSRITEPAIGIRVKLLDVGIGQHAQQVGQRISNGETIDLVMAGLTYPMAQMAADGLLLPLEDLMEEHAPSLREIFGDKIKAGYLGDVLYAIPAKVHAVTAGGLLYNKTMAQAAGVTVPDPCTLEELDLILNEVQLAFSQTYGTSYITREVSLLNFLYPMEFFGSGIYAYGAIFEPWNSMEIVNAYASPQYLEFCLRTRSWQENGLLPPNMMTSAILPSDRLASGQIFCLFTSYDLGENPGELNGNEIALARLSDAMSTTGLMQDRMWAVPVTSKSPEKALEFLDLLYTTPELANLLTNGIENMQYTRVSDHIIAHADGPAYYRVFSIFGDQREVDQWLPATEEDLVRRAEVEDAARISLTLGYTFDARPVEAEIAAVTQIISLYAPALECGLIENVEGAIALFNQELQAAGIDRIIEENQKQLSIWLSEQGR